MSSNHKAVVSAPDRVATRRKVDGLVKAYFESLASEKSNRHLEELVRSFPAD